jgi:hypothetical protein
LFLPATDLSRMDAEHLRDRRVNAQNPQESPTQP